MYLVLEVRDDDQIEKHTFTVETVETWFSLKAIIHILIGALVSCGLKVSCIKE